MTHVDIAEKLFEQKYHCSQAILAAFADELGLTERQALKIGSCFVMKMVLIFVKNYWGVT